MTRLVLKLLLQETAYEKLTGVLAFAPERGATASKKSKPKCQIKEPIWRRVF
jgi:hypothetical protein